MRIPFSFFFFFLKTHVHLFTAISAERGNRVSSPFLPDPFTFPADLVNSREESSFM